MTSVAVVHAEPQPFALADYLNTVSSTTAIKQQQALSAAYDTACNALIGPNDVQQEGKRTFKKKSAWRKLARHFNISVAASLDSVRVDTHENGFTAYAVATASAPWGQSWTDVGACSSDEATGRRTITIADAIATAMTRASNRAVSNLIAMGEVSAEEIGERESYDSGNSRSARSSNASTSNSSNSSKADADKKWPWGAKKGTRLGDFETAELNDMLKWCRDKGKTDVAEAIGNVLADRALGETSEDRDERAMEVLDRDDDASSLPF